MSLKLKAAFPKIVYISMTAPYVYSGNESKPVAHLTPIAKPNSNHKPPMPREPYIRFDEHMEIMNKMLKAQK
jgi:hypothetical protein